MNMQSIIRGAALAFVCAAGVSGAQTVVQAGELADKVNNATAGERLILLPNTTYTVSQSITIKASNSGITIEGPATTRADKTLVDLGANAIDLTENATLTIRNFTLQRGAPYSIAVPAGCTLNAGHMLFRNATMSVRLADGGAFNAACSVFNQCLGLRQSGGVANIVQCTFVGTTGNGIRHTAGQLNLLANLFYDAADVPSVSNTATAQNSANWYDNIIGRGASTAPDTAAPTTFNNASEAPGAVNASPILPCPTTLDCWPGKLDPAQPPLRTDIAVTDASVSTILTKVERLRTSDFEFDLRFDAPLQIGADELAPTGRLDGWISGQIETNIYDANNFGVAGAGASVRIIVEVGATIDLDSAQLLIIPQLGDPNIADAFAVQPFATRIGDSIGIATWQAPSTACVNGYMWDGLAEVAILDANGTLHRGNTYNLGDTEYRFIIDTTPPALGVRSDGVALAASYLSDIIIANDTLVSAANSPATNNVFPSDWMPADVPVPGNASVLGADADNPPQVFFNWPLGSPLPQFTLQMQYIDPIPEPCQNTTGVVEPSGFAATQPNPTQLANAYNVSDLGVPFFAGSPPAALAGTFTQNALPSSLFSSALDTLDVNWGFGDFLYQPGGWRAQLVPAVTDLAGNRFEQPRPLDFWWFRADELTSDVISLQGPDDPEDPVFSWDLTRVREPNPVASYPCYPLVSYRLWKAEDPSDPNTAYDAVSAWSGWSDITIIDRSTGFRRPGGNNYIPLDEHLREATNTNALFLLTIMAADEAGNHQEMLITNTAIQNPSRPAVFTQELFTDRIDNIQQVLAERHIAMVQWGNEEDLSDTIDTDLDAKIFWNRYNPFGPDNITAFGPIRQVTPTIPGEKDWGSSARVPLPPEDICGDADSGRFIRVEGQFTVKAEVTDANAGPRVVGWEFLQEGRIVARGKVEVLSAGGFQGVVQIPEDLLRGGLSAPDAEQQYGYPFTVIVDEVYEPLMQEGPCGNPSATSASDPNDRMGDDGRAEDDKRRRNIKYLFRAATLADPGVTDTPDQTPSTFQFTVTPGDEFDTGEQPVKVFAPL